MSEDSTAVNIKDYPIIELDIEDIKEDKTNPNTMTLEQSRGLEKSLINFGRLQYIVVDQNNILIDGYHRWEIEKANKTQKIKVIQVNVNNEIDRKIMRETLNKLRGTYDPIKESNELLEIAKNDRLDELAELLGKKKDDLSDLINKYHSNSETGLFESKEIMEFDNIETNTKCPKCGYEW